MNEQEEKQTPETSAEPETTEKFETSAEPEATEKSEDSASNVEKKIKSIINDVKDESESISKEEIESGKGMAILSYLLPFIPYFVEKKNKFVRFHAVQGMNLLVIGILYTIADRVLSSVIKVRRMMYYGAIEYRVTPWWVTVPLGIIGFCISILAIVGLVYACTGKAKELPVVNKLKIFK